jgi:hypothetical protein
MDKSWDQRQRIDNDLAGKWDEVNSYISFCLQVSPSQSVSDDALQCRDISNASFDVISKSLILSIEDDRGSYYDVYTCFLGFIISEVDDLAVKRYINQIIKGDLIIVSNGSIIVGFDRHYVF